VASRGGRLTLLTLVDPSSPRQAAALFAVREAAAEAVVSGTLPELLAELERIRAEVLLSVRPSAPAEAPPTTRRDGAALLTVAQVAARLGRSRSWVYKNRSALPMVRFPTGGYGFSPAGLDRWIARRTSGA
jgi:predicted DNA-binding transcriptional regulator AlpA